MQPDLIVPVVMSCALLWWVSRGMTWTTRLVVAAITLALIICIVLFERSGVLRAASHDIGGAMNLANPGRLANCANQRSRFASRGLVTPSTPNQRLA
jgi:hypothetical protein